MIITNGWKNGWIFKRLIFLFYERENSNRENCFIRIVQRKQVRSTQNDLRNIHRAVSFLDGVLFIIILLHSVKINALSCQNLGGSLQMCSEFSSADC